MLCSPCTTLPLTSPLLPSSDISLVLSLGKALWEWGCLLQGPDVGDKQMKLFSILLCCAMAPELETLPTSFPLLLNTGLGPTMCIVIYEHCKTLLGPTCINLALALAFLLSPCDTASACAPRLRDSSAGTGALLPRAPGCAAAMLLCSPAPKGGPWEPAANPGCPSQGPAAAARCLSAALAAGTAGSRQEVPRASLYGCLFPVKFLWDSLSLQIYGRACLASEAQEPAVGSGQRLAGPNKETCCQEGTGLGSHLPAWCQGRDCLC